jgi:hypothetical protein
VSDSSRELPEPAELEEPRPWEAALLVLAVLRDRAFLVDAEAEAFSASSSSGCSSGFTFEAAAAVFVRRERSDELRRDDFSAPFAASGTRHPATRMQLTAMVRCTVRWGFISDLLTSITRLGQTCTDGRRTSSRESFFAEARGKAACSAVG